MARLDGDWYHIDVIRDDDGDMSCYDCFCHSNYAIETVASRECTDRPHIPSRSITIPTACASGPVILGEAGSVAQAFAEAQGYLFIPK